MLILCLWTTLPWIVLGQTYYLSFVFNNFRYSDKPAEIYAPDLGMPNNKNTKSPNKEEKTLELVSMERSDERKVSKPIPDREPEDDDTLELSSAERSHDSEEDESIWIVATTPRKPKKTTKKKKKTSRRPTTLSTEMDTPESPEEITTESTKATPTVGKPTAEIPKESREDDAKESNKNSTSATESPSGNPQGERPEPTPKESTISPEEWNILQGIRSHPPEFFSYPEARCHEDMDLHEVFGISLERDRGLPSKVLCTFNNSWGGPWLLTTRIELPVRLHMRQWFFGYLTEDYKDLSANFLALAHIMNSMRTAMLILGQDNSNRLVYNLYDDVVISSINDLFLLRKAELVEANTPDLLFGSVGKVFNLFSGRNRTCPLQVLGGWWASEAQSDCVFPVNRNVTLPGYMAFFIKPSLFPVNHTALYHKLISTRRPWMPTVNAALWSKSIRDKVPYKTLRNREYERSKIEVGFQLMHRASQLLGIDKDRKLEALRQGKLGR